MDYYDTPLAAIPRIVVLGVLVSLHSAVAFSQGLVGGSLVAMVLVIDLLFRNPPLESTPVAMAAVALVGLGWVLALLAVL
ncbi:hypothetical protein [Natrononativus amylolyticus]|uniref:hypothetical protein n=1 Tax=Natrononativus amylolyticus TaxID=2963434 RepID=UPI0020CBE27F|nr:hypothetical protein [Natrononativus amylolyticus]